MNFLLGNEIINKIQTIMPLDLLTEIRVRQAKDIVVKDNVSKHRINIKATQEYIDSIIDKATNYSLYAYQEEFKKGFLYYKGGIRIGIGGSGVVRQNELSTFKNITSLCIRIPHQIIGCSQPVNFLYNNFENTLIISPPGCGKTTLIRDLTRVLGTNYDVLVLDERYEFYGVDNYLDIGNMSDVIQGVPKHLCYEGGIRSLNPQIIVCDEILAETDFMAIKKIVRSGVKILASVHAENIDSLELFTHNLTKYFENFVVLSSKPTVGSIKSIIRNKRK